MDKKNILLCVSGGIAAYKSATIASRLYQSGYTVKVILTESAQQFITPLTFQTLTRGDVYTDTFEEKNPEVVSHIDLADWADLVLIAPATANVIGKLANGIGDDMLTTTLLAVTAPVIIAPAMNVNMYNHPAVKENMQKLGSFGYRFIEPGEGLLACGYVGKGRLAEPEEIVKSAEDYFKEESSPRQLLKDKKVLITAGPTREMVDPVRYFTNFSSGKMGYALARAAKRMGADVTLVSGPTNLSVPEGVDVKYVVSTQEMFDAVMREYGSQDIVIKCAAVADYKPAVRYNSKMKKTNEAWQIEMEKTVDILESLGRKKEHQILVGFAAETDNLEEYAEGKLRRKNLDLVAANDVSKEGSGFGSETNELLLLHADGKKKVLPLVSKDRAAELLLEEVSELMGR
ncbi:bifunctional phosphopantothenoylcysteine decarboxylase/phosphopantothenate--cysteine ligase CoaBC [Fictibacillus aquaticus]|uniref:Coenzyme A biosynthesis bifunctional protein CoaBC n=1 Tax=Fictibacillus aquaticus TaxID=2021314 RepID=A0A235FDC3_9BACL|nr:bifunctional phosphopantothenoylcysteine decarboxylase/phosphopantothenate--cysteine ligase CoaBC [Fictibacillus aquaticus]OYD58907.1 bifunctional phosphopantothenoylcysteine decarboxylase/phosphopantothenate--cysteine ligase CoaBC [Fictibacillus aquaticus]